jgi:hypothetical protein
MNKQGIGSDVRCGPVNSRSCAGRHGTGQAEWKIREIRRLMLNFGPLGSLFDPATFAVLLALLRVGQGKCRTGWFIESVVSAA